MNRLDAGLCHQETFASADLSLVGKRPSRPILFRELLPRQRLLLEVRADSVAMEFAFDSRATPGDPTSRKTAASFQKS